MLKNPAPWWESAVFYQVYPRSFADSNGDGIGDLPGITARLDYLADLGIDAIWLSPHYPSPQFDCGYDISDYTAVAPEYGTLADFQRLVDEAHRRRIRIILDLVLNHTSDQHRWFQESRSSRAHPRRDWYIWRDGRAPGQPPNDWRSIFGGSAWTLDPATGQYYYHFFFDRQPDLNWRNPEVKAAMFDAVRFWLDRGVDGFRLDAIPHLVEAGHFRDQGVEFSWPEVDYSLRTSRDPRERARLYRMSGRIFRYQSHQPETHALLRELRQVVDAYGDRVLIGETTNIRYHGNGQNELHMVFNFPLTRSSQMSPPAVRANQRVRLAALPPGAWPCNTSGNHDTSRIGSVLSDGQHDREKTRLAAALILTLRGTPVLYYGEEIGMTDRALDDIGQLRDMVAVWMHAYAQTELGMSPAEALAYATNATRDRCRTPMQWEPSPNGGFCPPQSMPWLPVGTNLAAGITVADQSADCDSLLNFYRRILALRRNTPALQAGDYRPLATASRAYLAFLRTDPASAQSVLVALNFTPKSRRIEPGLPRTTGRLLFSTERAHPQDIRLSNLVLGPFEVMIVDLTPANE